MHVYRSSAVSDCACLCIALVRFLTVPCCIRVMLTDFYVTVPCWQVLCRLSVVRAGFVSSQSRADRYMYVSSQCRAGRFVLSRSRLGRFVLSRSPLPRLCVVHERLVALWFRAWGIPRSRLLRYCETRLHDLWLFMTCVGDRLVWHNK